MNLVVGIALFFTSCVNNDTTVNKDDLNGFDFRLFQGTPAWDLAKATEDENVDGIKREIQRNKSLVNYREPRFGQTLLQMAVKTLKFKSVEALVELGANPNIQDKYDGSSPVMEAAKINNEFSGGPDSRYLKLLLKHGGDPNAEEKTPRRNYNSTRKTPLLNACSAGVLEYVKLLVEAGANVNYTNEFGESALNSATLARKPDIVIYLLNKNADFKRPMMTIINPDPRVKKGTVVYVYITDELKKWRFKKGSPENKEQQQIIDFLKQHGMYLH